MGIANARKPTAQEELDAADKEIALYCDNLRTHLATAQAKDGNPWHGAKTHTLREYDALRAELGRLIADMLKSRKR